MTYRPLSSLENENILQLFADRMKLKCEPTPNGDKVDQEQWYGKVLDPLWWVGKRNGHVAYLRSIMRHLSLDPPPFPCKMCSSEVSRVRKHAIFSIVELHKQIGDEIMGELLTPRLPQSKLKLIYLYIRRGGG